MFNIKNVELSYGKVIIEDCLVLDNFIDKRCHFYISRYQELMILGFNYENNPSMSSITNWHLEEFSDNGNYCILTLIKRKNDCSIYEGTFVFFKNKMTNGTEVKVKSSGYTIFKDNVNYVCALTEKSDKFCFSLNGITYTISNKTE